MATVGDIIDQSLRLANRVDPAYRQRALDAVDRNVRYFAERVPWPSLERREEFQANGSEFFTFPRRVRSIISIGDNTNKCYVRPGDHFERQYPEWELGGNKPQGGPFKWRHLGTSPVIQDPTERTVLNLNTTASDSQSVFVRGLAFDTAASGSALEYFEASEIVVAQETPTATVNQFKEVLAIEADTLDKNHDIVVRYDTGDLPAARILKNERHTSYEKIQWLAKPATGNLFTVRYYEDTEKIASESQILPPQVDTDVIVWRTVGDLHWISEAPQAAQLAWQRADELIQVHMTAQVSHGDRLEQAIPYAPMYEDDDGEIYE